MTTEFRRDVLALHDEIAALKAECERLRAGFDKYGLAESLDNAIASRDTYRTALERLLHHLKDTICECWCMSDNEECAACAARTLLASDKPPVEHPAVKLLREYVANKPESHEQWCKGETLRQRATAYLEQHKP